MHRLKTVLRVKILETDIAVIQKKIPSSKRSEVTLKRLNKLLDVLGWDIGLGRTLHLLLLLAGVIAATTSFVLSTLACSRPNRDAQRGRPRLSSIFAISSGEHLATGGRPITAWEFPPPTKDVELATTPGIEEQYPDEPPPPYIEQDNTELQSYL